MFIHLFLYLRFQFRFNPHGTAVPIAANCYMIFEPGKQTASLFARAERMGNIRDQLSQVNFNTYNIIQNPIWDGFMIPPSLVCIFLFRYFQKFIVLHQVLI